MPRIIETLSLFVLLGVVALRPLVTETYDSAVSGFAQALGTVGDPTPIRTLALDLLILLASLGWFLARALGAARRYRWTGLEWGAALVALAVVVSCCLAGNKRLAINGSIDWLCFPLLTITLAQLAHKPWHRRLLLAAVLASACAQAVQCFEQYFGGFEATWDHYQAIKDQFWARQGVDLSDPKVDLFERRIRAREATGFLPHSNVTGSYLVLCAFAALGVVIGALKRWNGDAKARVFAVGSTIVAASLAGAVVLTNSLGAWLSAAAGLGLWLALWWRRAWIGQHRTKAVLIGWACVVVGALAVIGHGLYHDSLPGWSLTFRWQYWRTSAELMADHPFAGVGRENFGRHYLQYKAIDSPEEVANPHNLFVQAAADWGAFGLIGVIVMVVGASLMVTKRYAPAPSRPVSNSDPPSGSARLAWIMGLTLVVTAGRLPLLGTDDTAYLYYQTMTTGLPWLLGFLLVLCTGSERGGWDDTGSGLARTGVGIGLFAFLLHDMINFATFVPATATTLFALLAFCVSRDSPEEPVPGMAPARRRWLAPAVVAGAVAIVCYVGIVPVARAVHHLRLARSSGPPSSSVPLPSRAAYQAYQRAAEADPLDPTPHVEQAAWLAREAATGRQQEAFRLAGTALGKAIARDPYHLKLRRVRSRLYLARARATGRPEDYRAAVEAAGDALQLYPQDPRGIARLADVQLEAGETTRSQGLIRKALENYIDARRLDEQRPAWGALNRFTDKETRDIQAGTERARRLVEVGP